MAYNPYGQPPQTLETGHGPYPSIGPGGGVSPQVQQWFRAVDKDQSGFITANELKSALVNAQGQSFSDTACRLMIGMFDKERTGRIKLEEFDKLYTYVNQWLTVFKTYDVDQSGHIEEEELTKAFTQMGYKFSPEFIKSLVKKSDPLKAERISVDEFIVVCVQIQRFTEAFKNRDTERQVCGLLVKWQQYKSSDWDNIVFSRRGCDKKLTLMLWLIFGYVVVLRWYMHQHPLPTPRVGSTGGSQMKVCCKVGTFIKLCVQTTGEININFDQ